MFTEIAVSLVLAYFVWFILATYKERRKFPPGPFPLPLIGNIHQVGFNPPYSMDNLRKKYGDLYTITLPFGTVVVVNSGEVAQEVLVTRKDDFAGRPNPPFPYDILIEDKDILFADYGPLLTFRRKIVTSALHLFGEGIKTAEERVNIEVQGLLERIEAANGQPFDPKDQIFAVTTNMICQWFFSKRFGFTDPTLRRILEFIYQSGYLLRIAGSHQIFPLLKYLPTSFMKLLTEWMKTRDDFLGSELHQHRATHQMGEERDLVDSLLSAYKNVKADSRVGDLETSDNIKFIMVDILIASVHTSSTVLVWLMLYMVTHRNVQEKVHRELDRVVGRDRLPCFGDAENLPYLQAAICEVIRLSAHNPFLPHRKAIRDSTIQGYHIPKGTIVLCNVWRIHSHSSDWKNPSLFKPERFLDEKGKFIGWKPLPAFLPFGRGRRVCPGQDMGKMQVFIVASHLLHHFNFELPEGEPLPSFDAKEKGSLFPHTYRVTARKRF